MRDPGFILFPPLTAAGAELRIILEMGIASANNRNAFFGRLKKGTHPSAGFSLPSKA